MRQNIKPYFVNIHVPFSSQSFFTRFLGKIASRAAQALGEMSLARMPPRSDSDRLVSSYSAPTRAKLPGIVSRHTSLYFHILSRRNYTRIYIPNKILFLIKVNSIFSGNTPGMTA